MTDDSNKTARHNAAMAKQKAQVDARIAEADTERGVAVLLTGNGKGKSSSAFGMVMRALGYDQKVAVVQLGRKSTRLNSSHVANSYAVFCLKEKNRSELMDGSYRAHE